MNDNKTAAHYTLFVYSHCVFNDLSCWRPSSLLSKYAGSDGGANVQDTVEQVTLLSNPQASELLWVLSILGHSEGIARLVLHGNGSHLPICPLLIDSI